MTEETSDAVAVLRDLWAMNGATEAEFDMCLPTKKKTKHTDDLGIQGMEDPHVAAVQSREWRKQMVADGKAPVNARSIGKEFAEQIQSAQRD